MEKYFEGEMPSKEELQRLCAEAVRQGTLTPIVCVSTKTGVGVDELLAVLAAGVAAADGRAAHGEEGRRRGDAQSRSGRAAGRPGVQDAHRPVRAAAELHPRVSPARSRKTARCTSPGLAKGHQDRAAAFGAGRQDDAGRSGDRRRHRGRRQDRRPAHGHVAGRGRAAADQVPDADGRPGRRAQSPRRRNEALRRAAQDHRGGPHRPPRARSGNQGDGAHRHERAAPAAAPRAAQAARQGRGRNARAEDSLSRNDPDQRRGQLPAQEAVRRLRPVRRSPHPHVSVPGRHRRPRSSPPRSASRSSRTRTTTRRTISCGSTRSSAARSPATSCRRSRRAFWRRSRPASSPATRCRTSASRCTSARTTRSTRTKRRSASPAGRRLPTCSAKRGRACWSRS